MDFALCLDRFILAREAGVSLRAFPVGEFNIKLNANQSFDTAHVSLTRLQQKNLYNDDFEKAVEACNQSRLLHS